MASPCVVVSQQFCAPDPLTLNIVKQEDGNFLVIDVHGKVRFKVTCRCVDHHNQRIVKNADDQDDQPPLLTLHQKRMTMHARWKVFRGDSSDDRDLLFSVKRSSMIQIDSELDVFLARNTQEKYCDFKLKCRGWEKLCTIYDGGIILAQMNKKDKFVVKVNANVDYAFILALVLVLDGIKNL